MKKMKVNFAIAAMVLGIGSAFASHAPVKPAKQLIKQVYGKDANGNWQLVGSRSVGTGTGQYTCEASSEPCRASFDSQPAQNQMPAPGDIVQNNGDYLVH
jgi:hypothetical protein